MQPKIAFLGLGTMGGPMAANLARHGYPVKAWNRTPDRPTVKVARDAGATIVSSLAEAVAEARIIFSCVSDVPDVEAVLLGSAGVARYGQVQSLIADMSTIGTEAARSIGDRLQQQGFRFLDAPVSGGDVGAQAGTLTIMVGGDRQDFEACLPLLKAMGKTIRWCGPTGSGQAVKLCNQVLCAVHMVALCEALQLAELQDIDPNLIVEICSTGAAGSWALANLGPKIIASDLAPGFMVRHLLKDLRFVKAVMSSGGENFPGFELANALFARVAKLDNGEGANQGTQAMIRVYHHD